MQRELAIGLGVYGVYLLVRRRALAADGRVRARRAAERIVALESRLGIAREQELQRAALRFPRLVASANAGYAVFNVGLTMGWLVHRYLRRDPGYPRLRRACVLAHLGAQPIFLARPVAPPRTLPRFVDTLWEVSGLDLEQRLLVRFYNPVAAMPSLHVAFATVTACAAAERSSSRAAAVGAFTYPSFVAAVVTATGNHFVLDSVGGAALGVLAWRLA
ncbi:MAG TPA: phosphatase PAP2 family protein [Gaiella sp.]